MEERNIERGEEAGVKGGAVAAYGPEAVQRAAEAEIGRLGIARWGGIWAGFVTAVAAELWFAFMGYAVWGTGVGAHTGFYAFAGVMYLISLALGGFLMSQMSRISDVTNAVANAIVLWGLNFTLLLALVALTASNVIPGLSTGAGVATSTSFTGAWSFVLFEFLALLFTVGGAWTGLKREHREEA